MCLKRKKKKKARNTWWRTSDIYNVSESQVWVWDEQSNPNKISDPNLNCKRLKTFFFIKSIAQRGSLYNEIHALNLSIR